MSQTAPVKFAGYFLEWQRIEDEKADLAEQSKDLFKAMKDEGYDTKAARVTFRDKRVELTATSEDVAKAEEAEAIRDLYRSALDEGLAARARPASAHAHTREGRGASAVETANDTLNRYPKVMAALHASEAGEITEQPETAKEQRENVLSQHEVRPGSASLGTEQQCDTPGVTAGETATNSGVESRERQTTIAVSKPEATPKDDSRKGPSGTAAPFTNPQASSSRQADSPAPTSSPEPGTNSGDGIPAFLRKPKSPLRPHCLNPDSCAGYGSKHCHGCLKARDDATVAA